LLFVELRKEIHLAVSYLITRWTYKQKIAIALSELGAIKTES